MFDCHRRHDDAFDEEGRVDGVRDSVLHSRDGIGHQLHPHEAEVHPQRHQARQSPPRRQGTHQAHRFWPIYRSVHVTEVLASVCYTHCIGGN